jgi:hypothetical protein
VPNAAIPRNDPNVRVVWGGHLDSDLDEWAEEHVTGSAATSATST